MANRDIDKHLQMRVRKYMEYLQYSDENLSSSSKDLELLPKSIMQDVQIDMYGQMIQKLKLFHLNFSPQAINRLALAVVESGYGPGEHIFKPQEISDSLYIVMSGRVEIYAPIKKLNGEEGEINISILEKGSIFGAEDFFYQRPRQNGAKAAVLSQIIVLTKEKLELSLSQSEDDYEKFKMLMDMVRFANTTRGLGIQCHFCQDYNHSFSECPNVTYTKKKSIIIARWNNSQDHARDFIPRRGTRALNSLVTQKQIWRSVMIFIEFQSYNNNGGTQTDGFSESEFDEEFIEKMISGKNIGRDTATNKSIECQVDVNTSKVQSVQNSQNKQEEPAENNSIKRSYPSIQKNELQQFKGSYGIFSFINNENEEEKFNSTHAPLNQEDSRNTNQIDLKLDAEKSEGSTSLNNQNFPFIQLQYKHPFSPKSPSINGSPNNNNIYHFLQKQNIHSKGLSSLEFPSSIQLHESIYAPTKLSRINSSSFREEIPSKVTDSRSFEQDYVNEKPQVFIPTKIRRSLQEDNIQLTLLRKNEIGNMFQGQLSLKNNQEFSHRPIGLNVQNKRIQFDSKSNFDHPSSMNVKYPEIVKQQSDNSNKTSQLQFGIFGNDLNEEIEVVNEVDSIRGIKALNNWETPSLKNFDVFKNFKQYFPNNNLNRVLERLYSSSIVVSKKGQKRKMLRKGTVIKKIEAALLHQSLDPSIKQQTSKGNDRSLLDQASPHFSKLKPLNKKGISPLKKCTTLTKKYQKQDY